MRARETWVGGRWAAREKAAWDFEAPAVIELPLPKQTTTTATAPMIDFLSPASLLALAELGFGRE